MKLQTSLFLILARSAKLCLCFYIFLFFAPEVHAQEEFSVRYDTIYSLDDLGNADVTQEITLTNNFSTIYASSYTILLEGMAAQNISIFEGQEALQFDKSETNGQTQVVVQFPDALVGRGKSRFFVVKYQSSKLATQNGQVWEFSVPRIGSPETIGEYNLVIEVPKSFGKPAYISPQPKMEDEIGTKRRFVFGKEDIARTGVVAAFGEFQIFKLNLAYHLENPIQEQIETEIALIPDTAYQRVYYEKVSPKPADIRLDDDGNWMAKFLLQAGSETQVDVSLYVQVFAQPQSFYQSNTRSLEHSLAETTFWNISNPKIQELARTLKSPREVYDFVVTTLDYDYSRVGKNPVRLGSVGALQTPDSAICMEFTDLYIALARAAGIPSREINGYAHTESRELQPLSLIADVLHAWPEYWDVQSNHWKPVDPTWADTTGGIDYFDKFDLSHITFAIHGKDSTMPYPAGSYKTQEGPQKDVSVEFATLPQIRTSQPTIEVTEASLAIPFAPKRLKIKITNPGPVAIYNEEVIITTSSEIKLLEQSSQTVEFLPPGTTSTIEVKVGTPHLFLSKNGKIDVSFAGITTQKPVSFLKNQLISIASVLALLTLSVLTIIAGTKVWSKKDDYQKIN